MTTREIGLGHAPPRWPRAALLAALLIALLSVVTLLLAACGGANAEAEHVPLADAEHPATAHADHLAAPLAADPLPGASLYHLASAWRAHDGGSFTLPELSGNAVVMVMFYGDCTTACPLLVRTAVQIEAALAPADRDRTRFVMVTFDTERDSPEKLRAYAVDKGLDRDGWRWLVGTPLQTRQLAAMLGVQYRDAGNGAFAHSNVVTVLDASGVPSVRLEGLGVDVAPAVEAVEDVLGSSVAPELRANGAATTAHTRSP